MMVFEKKIQNIIDSVALDVKFDADITDESSNIIASTNKTRVGQRNAAFSKSILETTKGLTVLNGKTFVFINTDTKNKIYLSFEGTNKAARDYALLLAKILEANFAHTFKKLSRNDCLRKILSGELSGFDVSEALFEHKVEVDRQRCVLIIKAENKQNFKVSELISEVFSKDNQDFLVDMDDQTIVLIKAITDDIGSEDLEQLAAAIFETIYTETSLKAIIAVGGCKMNSTQIRDSYIEAHQAINVGLLCNLGDTIFIFDRLLLERFLTQVPINILDEFTSKIFTEEFKKVFTQEMAMTVKNLFDNSLNLSEAARKLYIHRNTLVYRIDKIKKATGLDLRNFHDAVTFRIMMLSKLRG